MNLLRLAAFTAHWAEYPPIHTAFSAFARGLGGKSQRPVRDDRKDTGFPDRPGRHSAELPADMKDNQGYDAPDINSPILQRTIAGIGGDIHRYKRKSPMKVS